jgi:hypothetical protein
MGRNMHNGLEPLGGVETPRLSDFWNWVKTNFTPSYRSEIEAYLADSKDHAEVERRIQVLQRRGMI